MSDEYDSPWKEILGAYLPEFLVFFFPAAYREIDWARGYESLDKELEQIARDAALGKRLADKLFKVWLRNGQARILLIHVEIQGERDTRFSERRL